MKTPSLNTRHRLSWLALLMVVPIASGTVAEQRARLPPPAECKDPLIGTWKSHQYHPDYRQWTEFSLYVRRDAADPTQLKGTILNHSWRGTSADEQPPPCKNEWRYRVSMDAIGTVDNGQIEFMGIGQWRLDAVLCGYMNFGYNLDHFSGQIDHEKHEFQSVNNDGGIAVNEPTLFRRVQCAVDNLEPVGPVDPPPYQPPSLGCALW